MERNGTMSTDVLSDTLNPSGNQGQPRSRPGQPSSNEQDSTRGRRWRLGLLVLGVLAILATSAAFIPGTMATPETGPKLTHTITRDRLLVTVTEQGTLESSNNTEVKCKVRGFSTVTWVIPAGSVVEPGDELVRLDTKVIEEQVSLTRTNTHIATATLERTKANVARAEIAIDAYREGRFRSQLQRLEKELESQWRNLRTAEKMLEHSETLFKQGYVTELEVEGNAFTVTQAELELKVKETEIKVLNEYTRKMQLETLQGNLTASKSKLAADEAGLAMEIKRKKRAEEELAACVIKAETRRIGDLPFRRGVEADTRHHRRGDGAQGSSAVAHARPVQDASEGRHSRVDHRPNSTWAKSDRDLAGPDA